MTKKKPSIEIFDTTLRDGNQAIGMGLSLTDKILLAEKLDELGIQYIEGGWPNPTNATDVAFFDSIRSSRLASKIVAFGSTRRPGTTPGKDVYLRALVASGVPTACIFGKSWDLHVTTVIRTSLEENLAMIGDSVRYLKKRMDRVFYDAEHFFDGYRENPEYALQTLTVAQKAGADVLVLCDTNGGILPGEFVRIFREVRARLDAPLGVHMHNDAGCADANSFLGVQEGAVHVQGTMNGLGERCGNANLCTIIPGLQLKLGIPVLGKEQLHSLTKVSVFVSECANIAHNLRQPYVGESAFSHKAGAHADGVRKVRRSFEHVDPAAVGNMRNFVVSAQAGKATMLERLAEIGITLRKNDPVVNDILMKIKDLEAGGYQFEAAEGTFQIIVRETLGLFSAPFSIRGFRVIEEKRENGEVYSEATIKIEENEVFVHTAADGDGPVNALDGALRKALREFFPSIAEVQLEDYKVRVLDEKEGTAAKVRVLIESTDQKERWGTIGVSTNIIEASWLALIDSLKYKLMMDQERGSSRTRGKK